MFRFLVLVDRAIQPDDDRRTGRRTLVSILVLVDRGDQPPGRACTTSNGPSFDPLFLVDRRFTRSTPGSARFKLFSILFSV